MEPIKNEPSKNRGVVMAVLAYLGVLVVISYFVAKDDPFVAFHIRQGLVLFIIEILSGLLVSLQLPLWPLMELVNLAVFVLVVIGIVNVAHGRMKELPVVGKLGARIPL